jgi:hypothetical protein
VLLPIDETMPIPVTTTRLIKRSSFLNAADASEISIHPLIRLRQGFGGQTF